MEIPLKNNLYIRSDDNNYILSEKSIVQEGKNKGEEYWRDLGYYTKISHLLEAYGHKILRNSSIQTLRELKEAIDKVRVELEEIEAQTRLYDL